MLRRTLVRSVGCVIGGFVVVFPGFAEVTQSYSVVYYDVPYGQYQYRQLIQHAPTCVDGKKYIGCTKWDIRWDYKHRQSAQCVLTELRIAVIGRIFVPKIPEQALASNSILRRSTDALMRHEEGHLDFPVQAAYRLEHEIKKMEDQFRTCAELGNFINDVGNRFLREAQQRERQFDLDTKHGTVDGANF